MESRIKAYVGKNAMYKMGAIDVRVKIKDLKVAYGHERALIIPSDGKGQQWVGTDKLKLAI